MKTNLEGSKTILEGPLEDRFDMCWNVNLKKLNENSRFWLGLQSSKKSGKKLLHLGCRVVKIEVMSEDVGARKNDAIPHVAQEYFRTHPRTKLWRKCL
jgi:hypothetical protein